MGFWQRLRERARREYHVNVFNNETFVPRADFNLRLGRLWLYVAVAVAGVMLVTYALVAFTPLKRTIPGYTSKRFVERQTELMSRLDELNVKIARQDSFIRSMQRMGNLAPEDTVTLRSVRALLALGADASPLATASVAVTDTQPAATNSMNQPAPVRVVRETVYVNRPSPVTANTTAGARETVYVQQRSNAVPTVYTDGVPLSLLVAFRQPVEGVLTRGFDSPNGHFAVDIAGKRDAMVLAAAPGTVIFSDYTLKTGYVLGLKHANGYVSFYKHNAQLLKPVGAYVRAGEPIAVIGNSGENSTGPHLHFELWKNGVPIDPQPFLQYARQ
jgi:murein DD-endopeptidase MepM/ murein hydrolase activator NlpD